MFQKYWHCRSKEKKLKVRMSTAKAEVSLRGGIYGSSRLMIHVWRPRPGWQDVDPDVKECLKRRESGRADEGPEVGEQGKAKERKRVLRWVRYGRSQAG